MSITSRPGVRGGKPCIAGTRIAVGDVAVATDAGWEPERIAAEFGVSLAQVHAALAYFYDHEKAVREGLAEEDAYSRKLMEGAAAFGESGARMAAYLTTEQAAAELGVTASRVRQLILDGKLRAEKKGGAWLMRREDVEAAKDRPGPGFPKGRGRG